MALANFKQLLAPSFGIEKGPVRFLPHVQWSELDISGFFLHKFFEKKVSIKNIIHECIIFVSAYIWSEYGWKSLKVNKLWLARLKLKANLATALIEVIRRSLSFFVIHRHNYLFFRLRRLFSWWKKFVQVSTLNDTSVLICWNSHLVMRSVILSIS